MGKTWGYVELSPARLEYHAGWISCNEKYINIQFQSSIEEYTNTLTLCCEYLKEVINILGPIRVDSEEGANGLKVNYFLNSNERQRIPMNSNELKMVSWYTNVINSNELQ